MAGSELTETPLPTVSLKDLEALNSAMAGAGSNKKSKDLINLSEIELRNLRAQIDGMLPVKTLADMNMEEELVSQYKLAQALQNKVANDTEKGISEKDKGVLLRLATATLEALIKLQGTTYTSERLKYVEIALAFAFDEVPIAIKEQFYTKYATLLEQNVRKEEVRRQR